MYKAIDIARYIVNHSWDIGYPINNLKLQKTLYYVQGNVLRILGRPCFSDEIQAWDFGPVVPSVYREFRRFGINDIQRIDYYYEFDSRKYEPIKKEWKCNIDKETREVIDKVVDGLRNINNSALTRIVTCQRPYINGRRSSTHVITEDFLKDFFIPKEGDLYE